MLELWAEANAFERIHPNFKLISKFEGALCGGFAEWVESSFKIA